MAADIDVGRLSWKVATPFPVVSSIGLVGVLCHLASSSRQLGALGKQSDIDAVMLYLRHLSEAISTTQQEIYIYEDKISVGHPCEVARGLRPITLQVVRGGFLDLRNLMGCRRSSLVAAWFYQIMETVGNLPHGSTQVPLSIALVATLGISRSDFRSAAGLAATLFIQVGIILDNMVMLGFSKAAGASPRMQVDVMQINLQDVRQRQVVALSYWSQGRVIAEVLHPSQ